MSHFIKDKNTETAAIFSDLGAQFLIDVNLLALKLKKVRAFVFDWDGVFNDGIKGASKNSDFSEPDAMGIHILRYAYWLAFDELPTVVIVTGQHNESAIKFAEREHLAGVFVGFKDKYIAIDQIKKQYSLRKEHLACIFDDIIDYPLADSCEVRLMVRRDASPLMTNYIKNNNLTDYITFSQSPNHPVREICELIVGLVTNYDQMYISRFEKKEDYNEFWELRQSIKTIIVENK